MKKRTPGRTWRIAANDPKTGAKYRHANEGQFDELTIDEWFHIEQMDHDFYWLRVGEYTMHVTFPKHREAQVIFVSGPAGKVLP